MTIIAHRGGTDYYPEQSIASIRQSLILGADYVEVDVRFTRDGVPVISHDANAKRVFGLDAQVSDLSQEEFLALRHVSEPSMGTITLERLFETRLLPLVLHYKNFVPAQLNQVLGLIRAHGVERDVVLGMQEIESIQQIKEFDPTVRVLAFMPRVEDLPQFLESEADIIRLWEKWVAPVLVDRIHRTGKQCWIMSGGFDTVGYTSMENLDRWAGMGVEGVLINEIAPLHARKRDWSDKKVTP